MNKQTTESASTEIDNDDVIKRWVIPEWLDFIQGSDTNAIFSITIIETGETIELPVMWTEKYFDEDGLLSGMIDYPDKVKLCLFLVANPKIRCDLDESDYDYCDNAYQTKVSLKTLLKRHRVEE